MSDPDIYRWESPAGDKEAYFDLKLLLKWLEVEVSIYEKAEAIDGGYALLIGKGDVSDEEFVQFLKDEADFITEQDKNALR